MALDIGAAFTRGLADVGSALTNREARMYTRARRQELETEQNRLAGENLNNQLILSGVATPNEQGGLDMNLAALHNLSTDAWSRFANGAGRLSAFYDAEGNEVRGTFNTKPKEITLENGEKGFILEITTPDGEIKPVTTNRSAADDDVMVLSQSDLENVYSGIFMNNLNNGISGAAAGVWQNEFNFDNPRGQTQATLGELLSDQELLTDQVYEGLSELNAALTGLSPTAGTQDTGLVSQDLSQRPSPRGVAEPSTPPSAEDQRLLASERRMQDLESTPDRTQSAIERAGSPEERALLEERARLENLLGGDPNSGWYESTQTRIDQIDRELEDVRAGRTPAGTREELLQEKARLESLVAGDPRSGTARRARAALEDVNQQLSALGPDTTEPVTPSNVLTTQIPNDIQGARDWFANPDNQAALDQLPPEEVAEVRNLLQRLEVNNQAQLIAAVQQGNIAPDEFRKAARLIAWSVVDADGRRNPATSSQIYSNLLNEVETGLPGVSRFDERQQSLAEANFGLSRQRFAFEMEKYLTERREQLDPGLFDLLGTAYTSQEDGTPGWNIDDVFVNKLSNYSILLKEKLQQPGGVSDASLDLFDKGLAGVLLKRGEEEGSIWEAGIVDWIRRVAAAPLEGDDASLGNIADRMRIEYTNGEPSGVVFLQTNGVQAEERLDWDDFTRQVNDNDLIEYIKVRFPRFE
jgi:hypothetical protein